MLVGGIVCDSGVVEGSRDRPAPLSAQVSAQMSRMPTKGTKPEWRLRRALHARGLRYRLHRRDLPGRPDIVFPAARVVVFVDGCFWHRCPDHGVLPRNNRDWWLNKLEANVARDRAKDLRLAGLGWRVLHVWEHEDSDEAADRIRSMVRPAPQ